MNTPDAPSPERLWAEHLAGEFETKDVEATLATLVEDAFASVLRQAGLAFQRST